MHQPEADEGEGLPRRRPGAVGAPRRDRSARPGPAADRALPVLLRVPGAAPGPRVLRDAGFDSTLELLPNTYVVAMFPKGVSPKRIADSLRIIIRTLENQDASILKDSLSTKTSCGEAEK